MKIFFTVFITSLFCSIPMAWNSARDNFSTSIGIVAWMLWQTFTVASIYESIEIFKIKNKPVVILSMSGAVLGYIFQWIILYLLTKLNGFSGNFFMFLIWRLEHGVTLIFPNYDDFFLSVNWPVLLPAWIGEATLYFCIAWQVTKIARRIKEELIERHGGCE